MTLRYVNIFKDRDGNEWAYFRRHGKNIRLPGKVGSKEFMEAYNNALLSKRREDPRHQHNDPRSLASAISLYLGSSAFGSLAYDTQRTRRNELGRFREAHGHRRLDGLDTEAIERGVASKDPNPARNFLKALSPFLDWCVREKLIPSNPARGVKRPTPPNKEGFATWTDEYVERYREHHDTGTRARTVLEVLVNVGAARVDTAILGRQHIRQGLLSYRRHKTGVLVEIPVLSGLQAVIDAMPAGQLTFISTAKGTVFTKESLTTQFRRWCDEAGVPKGYSMHGLRKYAAKVRAEAGATAPQLMAWFGWLTLREAERYTRAADRRKMAMQLGQVMNSL